MKLETQKTNWIIYPKLHCLHRERVEVSGEINSEKNKEIPQATELEKQNEIRNDIRK